MTGRDPYACNCGEGRLRPAWHGDIPVLACRACGSWIEPDPDYPGADLEWQGAALAMCPPGTGDPEEDAGERDTIDETPEENLARITATLGFTPLPALPPGDPTMTTSFKKGDPVHGAYGAYQARTGVVAEPADARGLIVVELTNNPDKGTTVTTNSHHWVLDAGSE